MNTMLCEDAEWLCSEEAFSVYKHCMYKPEYKDFRAKMERYISEPSVKMFVCSAEGIKAGLLVLHVSGDTAEIEGIAVSEKFRRRGAGSSMILNAAGILGLKSLAAQTDDDAIGFYRKCCFKEERLIIEYPDGTAVRYNCTLEL